MKRLFCILFLSSFILQANGQEVKLSYSDVPLNEILLDLSARYNIQVSINAEKSRACAVTINSVFESKSQALEALAKECNLQINKIGEVYSFSELPKQAPVEKKLTYYLFQGSVSDSESKEPLPYAKIKIGNQGIISDENGRFSIRSLESSAQFKVKYLGYFIKDTVIQNGAGIFISLKAQNLHLPAVVVDTAKKVHLSHLGDLSGYTKFNDVSQTLIPGANNNWMFNYMRLYPGIMAAGESVSDYIIWGSYSGQNHILFDGITLFNSISVSNEIGRVNPSIIKSLDVYKAGYNVNIGDRTGGALLINGKSGNKKKISGNFSLNNQIANLYLDFPLFNKSSSLQIAGRKSYQIFGFKKFERQGEKFLRPEFDFTDFNIKFSTNFKNGDLLQISSIASKDLYVASFELKEQKNYFANLSTGSDQIGTGLKYVHNSKKRGITSLLITHSNYLFYLVNEARFKDVSSQVEEVFQQNDWTSSFNEYSAKILHKFNTFKRNSFQISSAFVRNDFNFDVNENLGSFSSQAGELNRFYIFAKDKIQISKRFEIDLGLRLDQVLDYQKPYLQPRLNGLLKVNEKINLSFATGKYYQFASQTSLIDSLGSESLIWTITDNNALPVQSAIHNDIGGSYKGLKMELGIDIYYKLMDGLARYYIENSSESLSIGSATSYGGDMFLKVRLFKHEIWASYSIGEVHEKFEYNDKVTVNLAPQSQLHEIKATGVFNFHPLYFSIASVYGTGIRNSQLKNVLTTADPYLRTDISFQYKFRTKKLNFDTGFSIVNLFNNRNQRLSQFTSFPDGTIASTRGAHFTPSVFFNLKF